MKFLNYYFVLVIFLSVDEKTKYWLTKLANSKTDKLQGFNQHVNIVYKATAFQAAFIIPDNLI